MIWYTRHTDRNTHNTYREKIEEAKKKHWEKWTEEVTKSALVFLGSLHIRG